MRAYLLAVAFLLALFWSRVAKADTQCPEGVVCVQKEEMATFLALLRAQKCRNETQPTILLDPITIIEDKDGRVYGTGAEPRPYTVKLTWCNYDIQATGKVNVVVARREPATWGFRFRVKAQSSFLFTNAFKEDSLLSAIDAGVLLEGFYFKSFNLNLVGGFRSAGLALGFDLTRNFGVHAGYALSYDGLRSNPIVGLSFALW